MRFSTIRYFDWLKSITSNLYKATINNELLRQLDLNALIVLMFISLVLLGIYLVYKLG